MPERNCIIVHGCPSGPEGERDVETRSYDKHWIPWMREQLIERNIPTLTPIMPDPWAPDYTSFRQEFEKHTVSERTILIGHSCGCAFLVRWLGESKQRIDTLVLVAPWKIPRVGDPRRREFYEFPIDETIKRRVRRILMFTSDTEKEDGKKSLAIYHAALGGGIVHLPDKGHYIITDMGTHEFPELLDRIVQARFARIEASRATDAAAWDVMRWAMRKPRERLAAAAEACMSVMCWTAADLPARMRVRGDIEQRFMAALVAGALKVA